MTLKGDHLETKFQGFYQKKGSIQWRLQFPSLHPDNSFCEKQRLNLPEKEARFSNTGVTDQKKLEQVITENGLLKWFA